jgi:hypothetical protein
MSEINVNSQYRLIDSNPLDAKNTPVNSVEDLYKIPRAQRYEGMTVTVLDYDGEGTQCDFFLDKGTANKNWKIKNWHINCGEF